MKHRGLICLSIIFLKFSSGNFASVHNPFKEAFENSFDTCNDSHSVQRSGWRAPNIIREAIELNCNFFFSADSFMIATGVAPAYIASRMIDEDIQSCFYDGRRHKNCCQLPWWCHDVAKIGIGVPIVALGSLTVFGETDEIRTAGRVFLVGMPFVIFGKELIKKWSADHCLRPKNGDFCRWKKYYGGFPSGHVAEAAYMAVLAGLRFGAKAAIPLTIFSLFVGATFINCNRHYTSQVFAGAAFGAMYAVAANRVIEHEISQKFKIGIDCDQEGNPALLIGWRY